jgi:hypothetical protein
MRAWTLPALRTAAGVHPGEDRIPLALLGVSRATLYQHLPELKAAAAVPAQAPRELTG